MISCSFTEYLCNNPKYVYTYVHCMKRHELDKVLRVLKCSPGPHRISITYRIFFPGIVIIMVESKSEPVYPCKCLLKLV